MADSAKLDLAERLKSLHSQLVPKGKQLSLIELVEALIPNVNEGLVVVSSCHGLGALLYPGMLLISQPQYSQLCVLRGRVRTRIPSHPFFQVLGAFSISPIKINDRDPANLNTAWRRRNL